MSQANQSFQLFVAGNVNSDGTPISGSGFQGCTSSRAAAGNYLTAAGQNENPGTFQEAGIITQIGAVPNQNAPCYTQRAPNEVGRTRMPNANSLAAGSLIDTPFGFIGVRSYVRR